VNDFVLRCRSVSRRRIINVFSYSYSYSYWLNICTVPLQQCFCDSIAIMCLFIHSFIHLQLRDIYSIDDETAQCRSSRTARGVVKLETLARMHAWLLGDQLDSFHAIHQRDGHTDRCVMTAVATLTLGDWDVRWGVPSPLRVGSVHAQKTFWMSYPEVASFWAICSAF